MTAPVRRRRPLAPAALLSLVLAPIAGAQSPPTSAPVAPPTIDPFYSSRLREGIASYEAGAYLDAAASLRVACFGMLDAPPELADCLVRLGLAQAAAGDREGFATTFRRLLEGEELLGLYSRAALPAELRAPFEKRAAEWVPGATLDDSPAFAHLARGTAPAPAQAGRRGRREEPRQAAPEEAPVAGPASSAAATPTPPPPTPTPTPPPRAAAVAAAVPAPTPAPPPAAPAPAATAPPAAGRRPSAAPMTTPAPAALPAGDESQLARLREQLAAATTTAAITRVYEAMAQLAARHPSDRRVQHTAGEVAYRASRWSDAVEHFRRAGEPGEDQPLLLFYFAVALWESGDRAGAVAAMGRTEGKLRPTEFVESYRRRILAPAAAP